MTEAVQPVDPRSRTVRARTSKGPARLRTRIGSYSAAGALSLIDGRSKEAVYLRRRVKELSAHAAPDGKPSATQAAIIERCAWLSLRLAMLDAKLAVGQLTDHDSNQYICWSNALGRALKLLGLKPAVERPGAALDRHLAKLAAQPARADDDEEAGAG